MRRWRDRLWAWLAPRAWRLAMRPFDARDIEWAELELAARALDRGEVKTACFLLARVAESTTDDVQREKISVTLARLSQ